MKVIAECPFCGGVHCIVETSEGYHCTTCEYDFSEDDLQHKLLRKKISCVCSGENATEENPIKCDVIIGGDEAQGLSELEKPQVTSVFQDHDGIVWVNIYGSNEPIEADMLSTLDLQNILDYLQENMVV